MKYKDNLQMKLEAKLLKGYQVMSTDEQMIGFLMLDNNLFYDEAKSRFEQAKKELNL